MSIEERDARIRELSRRGWSVRAIAGELGVSKSQVHRVLVSSPLSLVVGGPEADHDGGDEDPWELGENGTGLGLFDTEEPWPPEPFTFVGRERVLQPGVKGDEPRWATVERWVEGSGCSLGDTAVLTLYRYRMHVAEELGDHERAAALAADWDRQRAAYTARFGERA